MTKDKVYCFCCKLFNLNGAANQLASDGAQDWGNLSGTIQRHETQEDHRTCFNSWSELASRLKTAQTIDKSIQEQIKKEREHWKKVLQRIVSLVRQLAKRNLAFCGVNEKIGEESNMIFFWDLLNGQQNLMK